MDITTCPECGNAAEILGRDVLESTDGPVEHAQVVCVERHCFLMPVASLASPHLPEPRTGDPAASRSTQAHRRRP